MSVQLSKRLEQVSELARNDQYEDARRLCEALIEEFADDPEPLAKLAYVNAREGNYAEAVADITRAIELNSREPDYFYSRGRYRLAIGAADDAVIDFDQVIQLCVEHKNTYYLEPSRYFKAEALARAGRIEDALSALEAVSDDFETWDNGLTSKGELIRRCEAAKRQKKRP